MGKRARTRRFSPEIAYLRLFFTFHRQLQGGKKKKKKDDIVKKMAF